MARYGDYETDRQLASRGLTSVFVARRVAGRGPSTAVVKVLRLPDELVEAQPAATTPAPAPPPAPRASGPAPAAGARLEGGGTHPVFISHSTTDKVKADAVCAALEKAGVRCWIAPRDILPGSNWASSILRAIGDSHLVLLLLSESANESPHIRREIERAISRNVPVAPVRVQDVMPRDDLEYFLSASHWVDAISEPFEQHLPGLVEDVRALLAAQATSAREGQRTSGTAAMIATEPPLTSAPAPATTATTSTSRLRSQPAPSSVVRAALEQFLEAAEIQRRAADASPHWARVYEMGAFPEGAFFISEHCRHSVQRCIEAATPISEPGLYAIATGLVSGLADFHQSAGRPHGDVEASNVLLRADPRDAIPEGTDLVALSDPLSTPQLTARHTVANDLHDVGLLLFQLVEGERPQEEIPTRVTPSAPWRALGPNWRKWVELCTILLSAHPGAVATTALAREKLAELKPRPRRTTRALVGTAVVAAVLAVAVPIVWIGARSLGPNTTSDNNNSTGGAAVPAAAPSPTVAPAVATGEVSPSTPSTPAETVSPPIEEAEPRTFIERLWAVKKPDSSPISVTIEARQESCAENVGDCLTFTITSNKDGYLILLTQDAAGDLKLLVPNHKSLHVEEVVAGTQKFPTPRCGYDFAIGPPYGKERIKAIVSTMPLQIVLATPDRYRGDDQTQIGKALRLQDGTRVVAEPRELLRPDQWTVAECEIVTRDPERAGAK